MELLQAVQTRRSVRRYAPVEIPYTTIVELLDLAACAPSACNRRGWRCILVQKRDDLDWLYRHGGSSVLQNTGQALLVCYEEQTDNCAWDDAIQSAAAFIAYFQLIAHDHGIGSCWICHLPPKREICKYFGIPSGYTPVAAVSFGLYMAETTLQRSNLGKQVILCPDRWTFDTGGLSIPRVALRLRSVVRKLYYSLPFRWILRRWVDRYEKKFDE